MKKIPSLFKRDYGSGPRLVYDEVVPGTEWVINGEGIATVKFDGTACMVRSGELFKRYDRKLKKAVYRRVKRNPNFVPSLSDFKPAPDGWEACQEPDVITGHWPGWMPVRGVPEDQYHLGALLNHGLLSDGTYELVGPKIGTNPYGLDYHQLWPHGSKKLEDIPRDFKGLYYWFRGSLIEGIVWHHPDGRMAKIKRRDFGFAWPPNVTSLDSSGEGC